MSFFFLFFLVVISRHSIFSILSSTLRLLNAAPPRPWIFLFRRKFGSSYIASVPTRKKLQSASHHYHHHRRKQKAKDRDAQWQRRLNHTQNNTRHFLDDGYPACATHLFWLPLLIFPWFIQHPDDSFEQQRVADASFSRTAVYTPLLAKPSLLTGRHVFSSSFWVPFVLSTSLSRGRTTPVSWNRTRKSFGGNLQRKYDTPRTAGVVQTSLF